MLDFVGYRDTTFKVKVLAVPKGVTVTVYFNFLAGIAWIPRNFDQGVRLGPLCMYIEGNLPEQQ